MDKILVCRRAARDNLGDTNIVETSDEINIYCNSIDMQALVQFAEVLEAESDIYYEDIMITADGSEQVVISVYCG